MKILSKSKEKVNEKLKKKYPLLSSEIDEHYNDRDFHILEYDETTNTTTYLTTSQYEYELNKVLSELMIPIEEEEAEIENKRVLHCLSEEPCGVYGE